VRYLILRSLRLTKNIRIIRDCLNRRPEPIPGRLYEILLYYNLITTPQEERIKLFSNSPPVELPLDDPWIKHTLHGFKSSLLLHPLLESSTFKFLNVPDTVSIDILRDKTSDPTIAHFNLHCRFLNFQSVHRGKSLCPLLDNLDAKKIVGHPVCDCAVEDLMDTMLSEVGSLSKPQRKEIRHRCKHLLAGMPRHMRVECVEAEVGNIQTKLSWQVSVSDWFRPGFEVSIYPQAYGDAVHANHRFCPPIDTQDDQTSTSSTPSTASVNTTQSEEQTETPTGQSTSGSDKIDEQSNSTAASSQVPVDPSESDTVNCLWKGKTEPRSCNLQWDTNGSPLLPGRKYVALVRTATAKGSFYSEPFPFEILCPSPQNVTVKRDACRISVIWEFPWDVEAQFRVTCSSIYDQIYSSEFKDDRNHEFLINVDNVPLDLEVTVQAISNGGIRSNEVEVHSDAKIARNFSPSPSVGNNMEDFHSQQYSDDEQSSRSPSIQSSNDPKDGSYCPSTSPFSRSPSANPARTDVSQSGYTPADGPDRAGSDMEDPEDDTGSRCMTPSDEDFGGPSGSIAADSPPPHSSKISSSQQHAAPKVSSIFRNV
jgi:hypothetical protein